MTTRRRKSTKGPKRMLLRKPMKVRERLHVLRMKFKPGYADTYLKSLGFSEKEITDLKSKRGYH